MKSNLEQKERPRKALFHLKWKINMLNFLYIFAMRCTVRFMAEKTRLNLNIVTFYKLSDQTLNGGLLIKQKSTVCNK